MNGFQNNLWPRQVFLLQDKSYPSCPSPSSLPTPVSCWNPAAAAAASRGEGDRVTLTGLQGHDTFVPSPRTTEQQTVSRKAGQDVRYTALHCLPASPLLVGARIRISECDMSACVSEAGQRQAADKQADCSFVLERGCHVAAAESISQQVFLPNLSGLQRDSAECQI